MNEHNPGPTHSGDPMPPSSESTNFAADQPSVQELLDQIAKLRNQVEELKSEPAESTEPVSDVAAELQQDDNCRPAALAPLGEELIRDDRVTQESIEDVGLPANEISETMQSEFCTADQTDGREEPPYDSTSTVEDNAEVAATNDDRSDFEPAESADIQAERLAEQKRIEELAANFVQSHSQIDSGFAGQAATDSSEDRTESVAENDIAETRSNDPAPEEIGQFDDPHWRKSTGEALLDAAFGATEAPVEPTIDADSPAEAPTEFPTPENVPPELRWGVGQRPRLRS